MVKHLCVPESYEKDGVKKTAWNKIGILFEGQNGKQYVKLYHMPGVLINVYEQEKKDNKKSEELDF